MDFKEYQALAERTVNGQNERERYLNYSMGLVGEAGEVVDSIKKVMFHGHEMDTDHLKKELGDVLWYMATLASTAGLELEDVAKANVEKLKKRYPDGFSSEHSINRNE